jgi:hypothetical protein
VGCYLVALRRTDAQAPPDECQSVLGVASAREGDCTGVVHGSQWSLRCSRRARRGPRAARARTLVAQNAVFVHSAAPLGNVDEVDAQEPVVPAAAPSLRLLRHGWLCGVWLGAWLVGCKTWVVATWVVASGSSGGTASLGQVQGRFGAPGLVPTFAKSSLLLTRPGSRCAWAPALQVWRTGVRESRASLPSARPSAPMGPGAATLRPPHKPYIKPHRRRVRVPGVQQSTPRRWARWRPWGLPRPTIYLRGAPSFLSAPRGTCVCVCVCVLPSTVPAGAHGT